MKNEKYLMKILDDVSKNEICKLRKNYKDGKQLYDYLYISTEKIFKKLVFPYFRFEVLQRSIRDIKENSKYYFGMNKTQIKKINIIFDKLQKICIHLNVALDEYYILVMYMEKTLK